MYIKHLKEQILLATAENFEKLALATFRLQATQNVVYRSYIQYLGISIPTVDLLEKIPFLPIAFFKNHCIKTETSSEGIVFESSGTTGQVTSKHCVPDIDFYKANSQQIFEECYGSLSGFHVFALLPSYVERANSSLVYMARHFIECSQSEYSNFFLDNIQDLLSILAMLKKQPDGRKILLLGVTFALLDWAESMKGQDIMQNFPNLIVMETGGMKGRRKELLREEVHQILQTNWGVQNIHSEYGMTELLSQAYSIGDGIFSLPSTMKVIIREINDPFTWETRTGKTGGINIIDLANIDSCAFIETQDLGLLLPNGTFKIQGRFDSSDVRGCNLMVL